MEGELITKRQDDYIAVITGDIHTTGIIPECRLDNFPETILKKVNEVVSVANYLDADDIFIPGDLLDSADTAKSVIRRLGKVLLKAKSKVLFVNGNHDVYGGNPETFERCGTGILDGFNVAKLIKDDEVIFREKGNLKIQITGTSYHYNIDALNVEKSYCVKKQDGVTHAIHMAHGYLTDKKLPYQHTLIETIRHLTEADVTIAGHLHIPYLKQYDEKYFVNAGALGRDTAAKSDFLRRPQIYILKIDQEGTITIIPYYLQTAKLAEEVMDRSHIIEDEIYEQRMTSFIGNIQDIKRQQALDVKQIIRHIGEEQNLEDPIKEEALSELSQAEINLSDEERLDIKGMRRIKGMILKGFQSHKDTRVSFSRHITSFIGETDNGKTSIFRGFRLITENKPDGIKYIKRGEKQADVSLIYDDNTEIERIRAKSINRVIIHYPDGTSHQENDFGKEYPPKIKEEIGYQPVKIDTDSYMNVNYAAQLEGPFLLREKPNVKAKIIDAIANINVIGVALDSTNKKLAQLNLENVRSQDEIDKIDKKLEAYNDIPQIESNLEKFQAIISKVKEIEDRKKKAMELLDAYNKIQEEKKKTMEVIDSLKNLREAEMKVTQAMVVNQKKTIVSMYSDSYNKIVTEKKKCEDIIKHKDDLIQAENLLNNALCISSLRREIENIDSQYKDCRNKIQDTQKILGQLSNIPKAEKILVSLLKTSKEKQELVKKQQELNSLNLQHKQIKSEIEQNQNIVKKLANLTRAEQLVRSVSESRRKRETMTNYNQELKTCRDSIQKGKIFLADKDKELNKLKEQYGKTLKTLKVCPLCFSDIEDGHVHNIIKNL